MTDDQKYLLLVSHRSKLATLAINDAHKRTLLGGPTETEAEMTRQIGILTRYEEGVSVHQEECYVLPLQLRTNKTAHG